MSDAPDSAKIISRLASAPALDPDKSQDGLPDRLVEELPDAHDLGEIGVFVQALGKHIILGLGPIVGSGLLRWCWGLTGARR